MLQIHFLPLGAYQTNCYLVWDDASSQCIVIDPGYTPEKVLAEAEKLGKSVAAVLLTHGHFDHVGGVKGIADKTGCPVYLHEKELSLPEEMTAGPLCYTHTYGQGDTLSLAGLTIEVLHTPGHTPGSVCLQAEDSLFTGDTLFMDSCGRTDFPGGSMAEMFRSLQRLAALEGDFAVYPGHGPATKLSQERQYNPYMP
ncbi:MAG: MBL fold metallo-hydrolase [Oscillospiraceae bacterium]|nr:MBL fold metallo-hydrolase [Oscillospiraceae bacterium]